VVTSLPDFCSGDICLPSALHRTWTERALEAGKHVFLEKPIALTAGDADAVVDAAARHHAVLVVGLVLRFWPEYVELQLLVASGDLGLPRAVSTHRLSPPIDWNDWMVDREQSGGVPCRPARARLDQMNWLLGEPRVFCAEPRPATCDAGRV
jgi:predicted dehydrogenase